MHAAAWVLHAQVVNEVDALEARAIVETLRQLRQVQFRRVRSVAANLRRVVAVHAQHNISRGASAMVAMRNAACSTMAGRGITATATANTGTSTSISTNTSTSISISTSTPTPAP